jgi:hypothetical protein
MLDVGAPTIAQNVEARHLHLLTSRKVSNGSKKRYLPSKNLFHVKRIPFEWRVIRMRDSFERSWYSNDVRTVNIDWNISRNEHKEWRRKFWKDV